MRSLIVLSDDMALLNYAREYVTQAGGYVTEARGYVTDYVSGFQGWCNEFCDVIATRLSPSKYRKTPGASTDQEGSSIAFVHIKSRGKLTETSPHYELTWMFNPKSGPFLIPLANDVSP